MFGVDHIVSAVLPMLLERLTSYELLQFLRQEGLDSEIKKWEDNLKMINAVLRDAAEKQLISEVQEWLHDLEDLAYEVEDILDEFATDVLVRDLEKEQQEQANRNNFQKFVPTSLGKLMSRIGMGSQIQDVKHRLEHVTSQLEHLRKLKDSLGLKEIVGGISAAVSNPRLPSTGLTTECDVYGREQDEAKILKMVLDDEPSAAKFHVIPIAGMGGIGKTTLAQKVYNDKKVESFKPKVWVYVSTDFDVLKIYKTIIENISCQPCNLNDLNAVQKELQERIDGKKFLFVLDDVWRINCTYELWECFRAPLKAGASGSKIIVTTRDENVASIMGSFTWLYRVQLLSNDDCWSLFMAHAFGDGVDRSHLDIQSIRKKVVEKSKGLPLASKVLGRLLHNYKNKDKWLEILNNKMWDLVDERDIPATLKLSYFYLPSHLKKCFVYCSIFLKNYEFEREELVHLWLTVGCIQPSKVKQLEDLGDEYFDDLLSRSLFQQSSSNKTKYVMHDLVKDLAQWASKGTCIHLEDMSGANNQLGKARHLSYGQGYLDDEDKFKVISKVERLEQRLRTFLPLAIKRRECFIRPAITFDLLPNFKKLRMLSLEDYYITELPESIGNLRYLRQLNLSNTRIRRLPESTSCLINLLILKLKDCIHLRKLPSKMRNLTKLRFLDIRGVNLDEMPVGIDELKDLRYLSNFIVGKSVGAALTVLKNLEFLHGELCISKLENAVDLCETREMILNDKKELKVLELEWRFLHNDDICNSEKEKKVLHLVRPHSALERLTIQSYGGIEFPSWVGHSSFSKVTVLKLNNCVHCTVLPSLGLLKSLKDLTIKRMHGLKRIGNEFYGQHCSTPFQSLETLCFEELNEWEHWENEYGGGFPLLRKLSILSCPELYGSLPSCLPLMENLVIKRCHQLVVLFSSLPKLCNLDIDGCSEITGVDAMKFKSLKSITLSKIKKFGNGTEQNSSEQGNLVSLTMVRCFSNLSKLQITRCAALTSLPMEMYHRNTCLKILRLSECNALEFIINGPLPSSLKRLDIQSCHGLKYLWNGREASCTSIVDKEKQTIVLEHLRVYDCKSLTNLSLSGRLPSTLTTLFVESLPELKSIAESFHENISLEDKLSKLDIRNCKKLEGLPTGFHSLDSLEELTLRQCPSMRSFPEEGFPKNLTSLEIDDGVTIYKPLLEWGLHNLTILKNLRIYGHPKAESSSFQETGKRKVESSSFEETKNREVESLSFQETGKRKVESSSFQEQELEIRFPLSLTQLSINRFPNLKRQGLQNLNSLKSLQIHDCPNSDVALPSSLESLDISGCPSLTSISELTLPSSLKSLNIKKCLGLISISEQALPSSLESLNIGYCPTLTSISVQAWPSALQSLEISECKGLISISELALPSSLQSLNIRDCKALTSISKMGLPSSLQDLNIKYCSGLTSISELGLPSSLLNLSIHGCPGLRSLTEQRLPSSLLKLRIWNCGMLEKEWTGDTAKVWPNISHIPDAMMQGSGPSFHLYYAGK